jgi:predicted regulator of Ras-like GTPase activity (Roadblock/LC7/MglB family)
MLKSLFGDLGALRRPPSKNNDDDDGFAPTAIMESMLPEPSAPQDKASEADGQDLLVSGSASVALREHFAAVAAQQDAGTKLIAIIDPVRVWATLVISTLSEACNQPIERLHLREKESLRTLATVEQTTVVRNPHDRLKIAHADVRPLTPEGSEIQVALMERSQMTAVIVGPMQATAIDTLLSSLKAACGSSTWRCQTLLFMLPPNAAWIQHKIQSVVWPASLQVLSVEEPLTSASAVWNVIVAQWRLAKAQQSMERDVLLAPRHEEFDFSSTATPAKMVVTPELEGAAGRPKRVSLEVEQAQTAMAKMSSMDGLLACALVNDETSQVLARDTRLGQEVNLDQTASACAQLMRAHRQSATLMGLTSVDEITTSSGGRQVMLRPASGRPGFFMMALLDKQRTNMTLARLKLMELDKHLT